MIASSAGYLRPSDLREAGTGTGTGISTNSSTSDSGSASASTGPRTNTITREKPGESTRMLEGVGQRVRGEGGWSISYSALLCF